MRFLGFGLLATGVLFMVSAFKNESPLGVVSAYSRGNGGGSVLASSVSVAGSPLVPGGSTFQSQVP